MLRKIILKNFRYNLKNYLLFFLSNTLAVSLTLVFLGLKNNLGEHIEDEATNYIMKSDFFMAVVMLSVVAVVLTVYAVRSYVRVRVRDYSMLMLLGIRKKMFQMIIFAEYGLGWLLSVIAGFVCGSLIYYLYQELLYHLESDMIEKSMIAPKEYLHTFVVSLVIVVVVVMVTLTLMEGKSLDSFAAGKEIQEKKIKTGKWSIVFVIGIILVICGICTFSKGGAGTIRAQVMWLLSGLLVLYIGIGLFLEILKKRQKFYLSHLFQINQLNHHFTTNFLVIFMLFIIHFFATGYVVQGLAGSFPTYVDKELYPYDYILSIREGDQQIVEDVAEDYEGTLRLIPMFKVVNMTGLDEFGISQSTCKELTGISFDLNDNEVGLYKEDNEKSERKIADPSTLEVYEYLRMGRFRGEDLNIYTYEDDGYEKFDVIKAVSGNYLGCLSDGYRDSWIIMSDTRFEKYWEQFRDNEDEVAYLALLCIPEENRPQAGKELQNYSENYGVEEMSSLQENYYDVNQVVDGIEKRSLFQISSKLLLILSLLFSSVFIVKIKAMSDEESMQKRYTFLSSMGMYVEQRRKTARFEVLCTAVIPLLFGVVYGVNYNVQYWKMLMASGYDMSSDYIKILVIYLILYFALQFICIVVIAVGTAKKIIVDS